MAIYLVRHARAGSRSDWAFDDVLRPLSKSGKRQAAAIAQALAPAGVTRILSSPYVRCVQTVEPLAERLGLVVEPCEPLTEGGSFQPVLDLLASLPDRSVLCSHGDIIPETIAALVRRGMTIEGEPDWRKGASWILEREDDHVARATVVPPPP